MYSVLAGVLVRTLVDWTEEHNGEPEVSESPMLLELGLGIKLQLAAGANFAFIRHLNKIKTNLYLFEKSSFTILL